MKKFAFTAFLSANIFVFTNQVFATDITREAMVFPELPQTDDVIEIIVTNTACFPTTLEFDSQRLEFRVVVDLIASTIEQCKIDHPDEPDFRATLGPLEPGNYKVVVAQSNCNGCAGLPPNIVDVEEFTVVADTQALSDGGISGFYYNPKSNGHYLSVLEFDYGTLILWPTFDPAGNQALVYAVGKLIGTNNLVLDAPAWVKVGGRVSLEGEFTPAADEAWGTLSVEMFDCFSGVLRFNSEHPDFGSGELELTRLAFAKQIGCDD